MVPLASGRELENTAREVPFPACQVAWGVPAHGGGPFFSARLWNVSPVGLALWMRGRLRPGTVVVVRLGPAARFQVARVIHCAELADVGWLVGCTFLRPLSDQDLRAWLPGLR